MTLLWQEYMREHPNGFRHSRFAELYRDWLGRNTYTMVQHHRPAEKLFVDFSGMTMHLTDAGSGERAEVQIFVAATGYSQLIFVHACRSKSLRDWLDAHALAFEFLGGVPEVVVPDNLKAGVKSPCRYEPEKNPAYADLARHYGVAVVPGGWPVRRPKSRVPGVVTPESPTFAQGRYRTLT
jgi:transposase